MITDHMINSSSCVNYSTILVPPPKNYLKMTMLDYRDSSLRMISTVLQGHDYLLHSPSLSFTLIHYPSLSFTILFSSSFSTLLNSTSAIFAGKIASVHKIQAKANRLLSWQGDLGSERRGFGKTGEK